MELKKMFNSQKAKRKNVAKTNKNQNKQKITG